jgi:outer membrane protein TolC
MHLTTSLLRRLGAAAGLLGCLGAARAAGPLTLADAWEQVRRGNESLQASRAEIDRRVAERTATRSLSQPQIDLSAAQTWIADPITIDLDPIRSVILKLHPTVPSGAVPPFLLDVQSHSFLKGQATAFWPLYTGGRIQAAQRAGVAGEAEAAAAHRQTENSLFNELVRRYYALQLARTVQVTRLAVLEGVEQHLRQAVRLEEEGFINRAERLHADVARAEARRERQRADRNVEIAGIALTGLLAADPAAPPPTASPLFVLTAPLEDATSFIAAGTAHQPALAYLAARRAQAAEGIKAEAGRLRPEVYLFGAKELNRGDLTLLEPDWAAGIGVKFALWDRTDRPNRLRAARALERRVSFLEADTGRQLRTLIEKLHREVRSAQDQFAALDTTLALARENLRVRQTAFAEGHATSLEVVDAQLALARVETERARAAHEFVCALAALLEATGQPDRFFAYEARAEHKISP